VIEVVRRAGLIVKQGQGIQYWEIFQYWRLRH